MPDKYEMNSYIRNVNHPWFGDIKSDFKQLRWSPNRLLLCILCMILMNIDETSFFETDTTSKYNMNESEQQNNANHTGTNEMTLYHESAVVSSNHNHRSHRKQCREIPMIDYYGSESNNMYHNHILIGVMFGYLMKCRIPVLFTFINIIIRSGASFKPKSIPMFIDRMVIRPKTNYGSSYNLLNDESCDYMDNDLRYYEDDMSSSSESGVDSDDDVD